MRVTYLLPVLPPKTPQAEALWQEIEMLRGHFPGKLIYINPNQRLQLRIPRLLFGLHLLATLRRAGRECDLFHFYNPDPFPYPVLRFLPKPVVYSLTGGVTESPPRLSYFASLGAVTISDEQSEARLQGWGLSNVHLVRAGIDTTRFTYQAQPRDGEIRLLMASAPWTLSQFRSKGIDALLETLQQEPRLSLTLLWRGVHGDEIKQRIVATGVGARVRLIDGLADVNAELARVHAAIVLAETPQLVKAYPHSLLDSLAAGKPVLVSRAIPMADYVDATGCGVVVARVDAQSISDSLNQLMAGYDLMQQRASEVGKRDFSSEMMVESFRKVYEQTVC